MVIWLQMVLSGTPPDVRVDGSGCGGTFVQSADVGGTVSGVTLSVPVARLAMWTPGSSESVSVGAWQMQACRSSPSSTIVDSALLVCCVFSAAEGEQAITAKVGTASDAKSTQVRWSM